MAKEYNVGDRLYLPVWVTEKETNVMMGPDKSTTITDAKFAYTYCLGRINTGKVRYGEEGLLLTAEEIYASRRMVDEVEHLTDMIDYGRKKYDEIEELKSRNAELEALLKEVMATRDEAVRQNDELIADCANWKEASQRYNDSAKVADAAADNLRKENRELKAKVAELNVENDNLKADCNEWKDTANERLNAVQTLSAERNKVMAGVDELKNTLVDRTKDVQHLTEENAKLKAELDQRNKDFDAMKKDRDNLLADNKRTTAYYMEANRTASEAAEANDDLKAKIADLRNRVGEQLAQIQDLNAEVHFHKEFGEGLDKQQKELQARYDELDSVNKEQAEKIRKLDAQNAYLKRLSDAKKKMRIVLNNGSMYDVEVGDKVHPVYDMNNNLFFVKTEGGTVTSFLIGKEPGNIAGWYLV